MSPHDQHWIDDCIANNLADLHKSWKDAADIIETQNRAMRTVLNECPFPLRTPETCQECGNEACVQAWKEQNKIWKKDSEEHAYPANAAKDHQAEGASPAASKFRNTPKFHSPIRPASGSDLDLFQQTNRLPESEEEAA